MRKRFIAFLTVLMITLTECVPVSAEETFTGDEIPAFNTAERVVAVALAEVGYSEGKGNNSIYGTWNGRNYIAWCGSFVSWCAHKAGVPTSSIKRFSDNCDAEYAWFQSKNRAETSDYTPKAGDIIFIDSVYKYNHTGIVVDYRDGIVYTVEGNAGDMVKAKEYTIDDTRIIGYGIPEYQKTVTYPKNGNIGDQSVSMTETLKISIGSRTTLKPVVSPISAVKKMIWSSSDPKICKVNWKGEVVGKSAGTAFITVEITNGKTAVCKIIVQ